MIVLLILLLTTNVYAYTDTQIADAIWKAEGCHKSCDYYWGIRSVKYDSKDEARRIVFNTIRNNRRRYGQRVKGRGTEDGFLEFLAGRYCPETSKGSKCEYWLGNVRWFLNNK